MMEVVWSVVWIVNFTESSLYTTNQTEMRQIMSFSDHFLFSSRQVVGSQSLGSSSLHLHYIIKIPNDISKSPYKCFIYNIISQLERCGAPFEKPCLVWTIKVNTVKRSWREYLYPCSQQRSLNIWGLFTFLWYEESLSAWWAWFPYCVYLFLNRNSWQQEHQ